MCFVCSHMTWAGNWVCFDNNVEYYFISYSLASGLMSAYVVFSFSTETLAEARNKTSLIKDQKKVWNFLSLLTTFQSTRKSEKDLTSLNKINNEGNLIRFLIFLGFLLSH